MANFSGSRLRIPNDSEGRFTIDAIAAADAVAIAWRRDIFFAMVCALNEDTKFKGKMGEKQICTAVLRFP
jgi:hypothetical protein